MKTYGHELSQEVISKIVKQMNVNFTAKYLEEYAIRILSIPYYINLHGEIKYFAMRIIDRLLQKERRRGNIKYYKETRTWSRLK